MQVVCKRNDKNDKIQNPYYKENTAENYYKATRQILNQKPSIIKTFYDLIIEKE